VFPKITIVTPSYNQALYLEETILSVIDQDYPNLEFIVIDGGSKDGSKAIIQKYAGHLAYWVSEKDSGQSNAINKGLRRATGDIITWINSDDLLLPGALHKIAELFTAVPEEVGVIHGGTLLFGQRKTLEEVFTYGKPSAEKYLSGMVFSQPAAFFRRWALERAGLLDESLHYGMDYDLFARMACISRFQQVKTIFSKYRLHEESKSVAHSEKFRQDWNKVFLSLCSHLGWQDLIEQAYSFVPELRTGAPLLAYQFDPEEKIISRLDRQKVLYYFLADLLLHYYWYDERARARQLVAKLKRSFPAAWLREDKRVNAVIFKLRLPDFLLGRLKSLKQSLNPG
jgi:glycosyltransferase involved in cell wall biosynthesis